MNQPIITRTPLDRLRHTLMFEALLLTLLAPMMSLMLNRDIVDVGMLSVVISIKAMLINPIFNYFFDRFDVRRGRVPTERKLLGRIIHAMGMEVTLTATSLPLIVWWLDVTFMQALVVDMVMIFAVMTYTLIFNWGYDRLFPVAQPAASLPLSERALSVEH
ncbi:PACE efflux transporter [Amphritea pacifica]|uniref:PACE efflux transporter n=1 Tax=Amphritea pacifica TaxID=2811233 RepID=A0ABS2WB83_9GAMM|nr:PACE efflux transporter [Amphritea pacifica]MBN0988982.1 PACE efflux transporter [Amphritea pacifica]MBN1009028.1 PACE efflux transporter [Amphritea pacifica]